MTKLITAFPPLVAHNPHTLILGTMPGEQSLKANQYYAHPKNQFWKFMGEIYGADPALPYDQRVRILVHHGIAVWDVVRACVRHGSMDQNIKEEEVNDFETFYRSHQSITRVVFNSLTAERIYKKKASTKLSQNLEYWRVPSPSPANARMSYRDKLALWAAALPKAKTLALTRVRTQINQSQ
jgi:TDG/mug DNA glycosylase family protein